LTDAPQDQFFRKAPRFGRRGRLQTELHQIEQMEFAKQARRHAARNTRVRGKFAPDRRVVHPARALRDAFEDGLGQILALEKNRK